MFSVGGHETARLIGMSVEEALLHKFDYHIVESDPDVVVLRCQDGAYVAAFSAKGAAGQGILEAAREDYRGLIEANAGFFLEPSRRGRESKEECLEPHEAKLSAIRSGHPPPSRPDLPVSERDPLVDSRRGVGISPPSSKEVKRDA
jgi:hypothetical protein